MSRQDEHISILIQKGLLSSAGEINANAVNVVSGKFTSAFCDAYWELAHNDINVMTNLYDFLKELLEDGNCAALIGCLTALYITLDLSIPDVVRSIFLCGNEELQKIYFYEFLLDYEDVAADYDENTNE